MGGIVSVLISVLSTTSFHRTGHPILLTLCIVAVTVSFWSWEIMHNYATDSAKARHDCLRENMIFEGKTQEEVQRLDDIPMKATDTDVNAIPDWLAAVSIFTSLAGLGLFIWGVFVCFF